jgi:hypothetical protein
LKTLTPPLLFGLLCLLFIGCVEGNKKVTLRLKYQPGMKLVYDQTSKSGTRVTASDSLIEESSHTYNVDITFDIISLDKDGTAEVLDSSTWSYDVTSKEDSTKTETVDRSRVSTLFVQPNGRYTDMVLSPNEKLSTVTWLKSYFEQGMPVFPDGELTPGYSWTQSTKVLLPDETMNASTTYRIKSLAREAGYDCAVIEYDGNMVIPVVDTEMDSCTRQGYDEIMISGVTYFAYKEGIVIIERQNWQVEGHRTKTCDGIVDKYHISTKSDLEFMLTEYVKP